MTDGYLQIGKFSVYPWSISGLETCVVVKFDDVAVTFDLGYSCRESISSKFVFLSHGHMDHISGVPQHVTKRGLYGMKPAKYYTPVHLVKPLIQVCKLYARMAENVPVLENEYNIIAAPLGEDIKLPGNYIVRPFPTVHRVFSQGYIIYKQVKKLKEEFQGKSSQEIAEKVKEGQNVNDIYNVPEIAYTGDTMVDVFMNPPTEDLLKVKLLITEATYIDQEGGKDVVQKARDRGHIHLQELSDNADLFKNIESILLIHFSDKYSPKYIKDVVIRTLPESLSSKVYIGTSAKEKYE